MNNYIAWLNGHSVAVGTRKAVEAKAREIYASDLWQQNEGHRPTKLQITCGSRQNFVAAFELPARAV